MTRLDSEFKWASTRRRVRALTVCVATAAVGAVTVAEPLMAQQRMTTRSEQRKKVPSTRAALYSVIGAATGGVMAMGYYAMSQQGDRAGGCRPFNCAMPFLVVSGAISGLFIAKEIDAQRRVDAPRTGESFTFSFSEAGTLAPAIAMDVRDSLVAVVSDSGAQLFTAASAPKALRRRAVGLSSLRQVVILPASQTMVLGTGTALWEASLGTGPATRIGDGPVDALASSPDGVMSAVGQRIRLRRGSGPTQRVDSLQLGGPISALAYDETSHDWWVSLDTAVLQIVADEQGLRAGKSLAVPATARSIATNGQWIAAALGDAGVIAWRREALGGTAPTSIRVSQEPRFAYDLAFLNDDLFVAGGVDGLFRLELSPSARVVGSSRQFPFATTVKSQGGFVWVGDISRRTIARVTP